MKRKIILAMFLSSMQINSVLSVEQWTLEHTNKVILLPFDGINIPIPNGIQSITINHVLGNPVGFISSRHRYSMGSSRSVTRVAGVTYGHPGGTTYGLRPTLYLSLCGFSPSGYSSCADRMNVERVLSNRFKSQDLYQYKHFGVYWKTNAEIRTQADDIADYVNGFLNQRDFPWDVVIIGFSRGGIFAHELGSRLVHHSKIRNLHSILLDPTAAGGFVDQYPLFKQEAGSGKNHFGSLFYDNQTVAFINPYTVGDQPIFGYDNYGRGISDHYMYSPEHEKFWEWWNADDRGLARALVDIESRKDSDVFPVDDDHDGLTSGYYVVTVDAPDFDYDVGVEVTDEQVNIWANMTAAGQTVLASGATVGKDGAMVNGGTLVANGQAVVNEDQLAASVSTPLVSFSASLDKSGFSANVSNVYLNASINGGGIYDSVTGTLQSVGGGIYNCYGFC